MDKTGNSICVFIPGDTAVEKLQVVGETGVRRWDFGHLKKERKLIKDIGVEEGWGACGEDRGGEGAEMEGRGANEDREEKRNF